MFRRTKKSSSPNQNRRFRPQIESLESRLALAGNVTVLLAGPSLYLTGDNLANELRIEGTGPGAFTVAGVATSLGGVAAGTRNFTGITNIFLTMKDGNDTVTFVTAELPGLLSFNGGNQDDELLFGEFAAGDQSFGSISANLGNGNDTVRTNGESNLSIQSSFISNNGAGNNTIDLDPEVSLNIGLISVLGGVGDDLFDLGTSTFETTTTLGSVIFNAGAGTNRLFIDSDITVNGSLIYTGLGGNDFFYPGFDTNDDFLHVQGSVTLSLGNGNNEVRVESHETIIGGLLTVLTGSGIDSVTVSTGAAFPSSFSALAVNINTGAGNDTVTIDAEASTIGSSLVLTTGAGLDTVTLFALLVNGPTVANLGDGNNTLNVDNSRFRGPVSLVTGTGIDTINLESGNFNDGIGTRFDGPVTVLLGAGNDTINLGFDVNDFVRFASVVSVNGGNGNDTIVASGFDFFAFAPILTSILIV
jgi:hypothetical protein